MLTSGVGIVYFLRAGFFGVLTGPENNQYSKIKFKYM